MFKQKPFQRMIFSIQIILLLLLTSCSTTLQKRHQVKVLISPGEGLEYSSVPVTGLQRGTPLSSSVEKPVRSSASSATPSDPFLGPNEVFSYPPYIRQYAGAFRVPALAYDQANARLFFGYTYHGLGIYYPENGSLQELPLPPGHFIHTMALGASAGELYLGTFFGFFVLDLASWELTLYNEESSGLSNNHIRHLAVDDVRGRLFISTDDGLNIFFSSNHTFVNRQAIPETFRSSAVGALAFSQETNELFIASGEELYHYNLSSNAVTRIFRDISDLIRSLALDFKTHRLFMGFNGITIFNITSRTVIAQYNEKDGMHSHVVENLVFTSAYGGLVFASQKREGAALLNCSSDELSFLRREQGLFSNVIGGFTLLSPSPTNATANYPSSCSSNQSPTRSLVSSEQQQQQVHSLPILVVGTRGALAFYHPKKKNITSTVMLSFDLPTARIWEIDFSPTYGQAFIGGDEYLCLFDPATKQFKNYDYISGLSKAYMGPTIEGAEYNQLFVATSNGLCVFDLTLEAVIRTYTTADGLADNNILSLLYIEQQDTLFIGTTNGLSVLNLVTEEIDNYLVYTSGVNNIKDLLFDEENQRVFIGTSNHLEILDLLTMDFETIILGENLYAKYVYELQYYSENNILFAGTANGLYLLDSVKLSIIAHFTGENSALTDNLIDGLFFDPSSTMLFIANLGVVLYDVQHDFWINLNDAQLEVEGLHRDYISDLSYYQSELYLVIPHEGFYVLCITDYDVDGLYDCCEEWIFGTNSTQVDTDADGYSDGEELWKGTDPLNPDSFPQEGVAWWWVPLAVISPIILVLTFFLIKKRKQNS
ncbi:MAG: hypothetical protein GF308_19060 [Candidatus Heimdallarchaeota archaeon]|nr:hypothetical protein [Candidatus Heimdallarchaeota archaeon]